MTQPTGFEIAIIGMAGRFPGAPDVATFWRNLRAGVESVTQFSDAQLRERGVPAKSLADPDYVKAGIVLEGMDRFDAGLFDYSPREALYLDPQQRVFLECAWEALEHSGYLCEPQLQAAPVIGVYGGEGANLYLLKHVLPAAGEASDIADLLGLTNGNSAGSLCTRVAYKLNLRGPALSVQTECSTSLVAVHLACSALLSHDCDVALAGGVWLNLLQGTGYRYQAGAILAPDGHCRAFDAKADGTLIGSGAGVVVLKRLEQALLDGDTIHAVIKGSAINNDGADKIGFTAPSVSGQAEVIRAAQAMADVAPDSISYVEAHGTGTRLGDPIELAALTEVFAADGVVPASCAIGSVKTNIGHLDAAAGVAGLIKTVLALEHATLPASLNFDTPNPQIDFSSSPFYVNTQTRAWPASGVPRRAAVSSFGIGGTNAHVVLEEAPAAALSDSKAGVHLLRLSARSAEAVAAQVRELADHLGQHAELSLADVDHTLRVGRRRFAERAVVIGEEHSAVTRALRERDGRYFSGRVLSQAPGVGFVLGGEVVEPVASVLFAETAARCWRLLDQHAVPRSSAGPVAAFVSEYALTRLWMSWGVTPDALLGHGSCAYVAACLADVMSLEDALLLVAARQRWSQSDGSSAATAELTAQLGKLKFRAPRIPLVSSVTGQWLGEEVAHAHYWIESASGDQGLEALLSRPDRVVLTTTDATKQRVLPMHGSPLQLAASVAQLWIAGIEIDAAAYYGNAPCRRIPLPTYPFERQSYWLAAGPRGHARPPEIGDWLHAPAWRRLPALQASAALPTSGCTLVLGAAGELTDRLIEHLRARGVRVASAQPAAAFAALDDQHYALRPTERGDYEQLLRQVGPVTHICHLLSLEHCISTQADSLDGGFFSLLALAQALDSTGNLAGTHRVALTVVSNHLEDVSGLDPVHPVKAALYGPCRVMPLEYPNLECRVLDVLEPASERVIARVAEHIQAARGAAVTALRGTHLWVKEYEALTFEPADTRLRMGGTYLITGGLGGVGLALARYLATAWKARLVLLSRTEVPPRSTWQQLIDSGDSLRSKLQSLLDLEAAGTAVHVLQADVSDAVALSNAVRTARERCGDLHGVIHAAGIAGGGLMARRTREAIDAVFAPKISGTQTLLEVLAGESLDFVLLCSSLTAVTGDIGQVDYCGANCVLDALATRAAQRGTGWVLCVNFDAWRDTGMAAGLQLAGEGMSVEQGIAACVRLLSGPQVAQAIVSTLALEQQFVRAAHTGISRVSLDVQPAVQRQPRPQLQTAYVLPAEGLEQDLAELWSEFLGVSPIGAQDTLFELGGDSLLALQLLAKVRSAYDVEIEPAELLRTPTIAALAELVELHLIEQIELADGEQRHAAAR